MHSVVSGHYPDCRGGSCRCKRKRYGRVMLIGLPFCVIEGVIGVLSGSTSLLADAAHAFGDNMTFLVGYGIAYAEEKSWRAVEMKRRGELVILLLLIAFVAGILIQALTRMVHPELTNGWITMSVASVAALANYAQHRVLSRAPHEHRDTGHRLNVFHLLGDLGISIGVVVSGVFTALTHWPYLDPILSIAVVFWITVGIVKMFRENTLYQ